MILSQRRAPAYSLVIYYGLCLMLIAPICVVFLISINANGIVDVTSQCDVELLHTRPTAQRESYLVDGGHVAFCAYSSPIQSWLLPRSRRTARYLLLVIGIGVAESGEHDRPRPIDRVKLCTPCCGLRKRLVLTLEGFARRRSCRSGLRRRIPRNFGLSRHAPMRR